VFIEYVGDVVLLFDNARAQVFIRREDDEVFVCSNFAQSIPLGLGEVVSLCVGEFALQNLWQGVAVIHFICRVRECNL
jgi:hypothetical protein